MLAFRVKHPDVPVVPHLNARIYASVTTDGGKLDMSTWHVCDTTHCRGGWTVVHAGAAGAVLEAKTSTQTAAALIYLASTGCVPNFFASNEVALEDLKRGAAEDSLPAYGEREVT